jgi:hypothetical protein
VARYPIERVFIAHIATTKSPLAPETRFD